MFKKNINDFPRDAYMYGNYGNFLFHEQCYEEAAQYYQKAVDISPYPKPVERLKESRQKAGLE